MFVPAVHALEKIGLDNEFKANSINFLVDNRATRFGNRRTVLNLFSFLTKDTSDRRSVIQLAALEVNMKKRKQSNVCFEKLVVGMLHNNLVHQSRKPEVGMLRTLRDYLDNMYPLTKESNRLAINDTGFSSNNERR